MHLGSFGRLGLGGSCHKKPLARYIDLQDNVPKPPPNRKTRHQATYDDILMILVYNIDYIGQLLPLVGEEPW